MTNCPLEEPTSGRRNAIRPSGPQASLPVRTIDRRSSWSCHSLPTGTYPATQSGNKRYNDSSFSAIHFHANKEAILKAKCSIPWLMHCCVHRGFPLLTRCVGREDGETVGAGSQADGSVAYCLATAYFFTPSTHSSVRSDGSGNVRVRRHLHGRANRGTAGGSTELTPGEAGALQAPPPPAVPTVAFTAASHF